MRRINSTVFRIGLTVNWKNKSKLVSYKSNILGTKVVNSWLPYVYKSVAVQRRKKLNNHQKWLALRYILRSGRRRFLSMRSSFNKAQFMKVLSFLGVQGVYKHSILKRPQLHNKKARKSLQKTKRFWVLNQRNNVFNRVACYNNRAVNKAIFLNASFTSKWKVWFKFLGILSKGRHFYSYNRFWKMPFCTIMSNKSVKLNIKKVLTRHRFSFNRKYKRAKFIFLLKQLQKGTGFSLYYKAQARGSRHLIKPVNWSTELRRNSFLITLFTSFLKPMIRMPRAFGKTKIFWSELRQKKRENTLEKLKKAQKRVRKITLKYFLRYKNRSSKLSPRRQKKFWRAFIKKAKDIKNSYEDTLKAAYPKWLAEEKGLFAKVKKSRIVHFKFTTRSKFRIKTNEFMNQVSKYFNKDIRVSSVFTARRKPVVAKFFMRKQFMLANRRRMRIFYKFHTRLFYFIDTALFFRSSFLLASCLKQEIENTRYHYKCLNTLGNLTSIALLSRVNVQGIFIRMRGTLNKTQRTRTWSTMLWSNHIEFTNPKVPTQYTLLHCVTYKGTFGLGVWII